jgi:hypothetical protein
VLEKVKEYNLGNLTTSEEETKMAKKQVSDPKVHAR